MPDVVAKLHVWNVPNVSTNITHVQSGLKVEQGRLQLASAMYRPKWVNTHGGKGALNCGFKIPERST